ncbi:Polysaccharide pyruvyl transferase [Microbacterium hydrocarbonoxydans]|uniref:Polysaccharide pyruvyl transferase n=2 Tax=Microbacterium hydrocarbonoxydans TaxID=273678 RepID=A0A0M2HSU3_9MICO|nr:Polysaccharide pyruvyl transferase [Microbacterium hydrocarbonoxydans]
MTGPDGNLGDILIRRASLEWVRTPSGVSAFVGSHPQSWLDAMDFTAQDTMVFGGSRERIVWLLKGAFGPKKPILVTDPGETWVGRNRLPHHLFHLAVGLVIKARGGAIIIPPHALAQQRAASKSTITLSLHRLFARLADVCLWREPWSKAEARTGVLVPDIAFSRNPRAGADTRDLLIVSLRGDRPLPSRQALDAIRSVGQSTGLEVVAVSQVDVDDERAQTLSSILQTRAVIWDPEDQASAERVSQAYDRAALVISDRLHVLILGLLSGAMPVELAPSPERKIAAHFSTIGLDHISFNAENRSEDEISFWLSAQIQRREEAVAAMRIAHEELQRVADQVGTILRRRSSHAQMTAPKGRRI